MTRRRAASSTRGRAARALGIVISSAPQGDRRSRRAAPSASAGWVPTREFHDVRTGRRFTRPVAACTRSGGPSTSPGSGCSRSSRSTSTRASAWRTRTRSRRRPDRVRLASSLYVATQKWVDPGAAGGPAPASQTTVIDRFDVSDPDTTTFAASGEVPGYLLNQFSLSEYGGYLRVASTSRPIWWGGVSRLRRRSSQSYVTVLSLEGRRAGSRSARSRGSGRASRSTRCASSTTWATWSRSARSTRSTRST